MINLRVRYILGYKEDSAYSKRRQCHTVTGHLGRHIKTTDNMRYSFRKETVNKLGTEAKDLDTIKATDSKAAVFIIPNALTPGATHGVSLPISVHRVLAVLVGLVRGG